MPASAARLALLVALAVATATGPAAGADDERLWAALKAGGHVIMIRHALTTPGVGDPPGMRLESCATQRNLSEEGRAEARRLGEALRARGVPVGAVLSSPWCRCLETARLAFGGTPDVWTALGNLYGRPEARDGQVREMRGRLGQRPATGNLVLVSHGSTILAVTGINPATAEMVIVTPQGNDAFTVAGRLRAR